MDPTVGFVTADEAPVLRFPLPEIYAGKVDIRPDALISSHRYFDSTGPGSPEAFLAEFPAPCTTRAHFHEVDQFQLLLPGAGVWYQRHDLDEVVVHYTDAYTVYGPFGARGPVASRLFTLRATHSEIAGYLPEHRDLLVQRGRRNYKRPVRLGDRPPPGELRARELVAPETDGLACHLFQAGAGAAFAAPSVDPRSPGQYVCVVRGSLAGRGPWSLAWIGPNDPPDTLTAGPDGADVVLLQFPVPTTRPAAN